MAVISANSRFSPSAVVPNTANNGIQPIPNVQAVQSALPAPVGSTGQRGYGS